MDNFNFPADRAGTLALIERLRHGESFPASAMDFLTFCFRASDQDIYYHAAECLGAWMPFEPALADWFRQYSTARQCPVDGPVTLDGRRSQRRMLIGRCAAYRADPGAWSLPFSLAPGVDLPQRPSDLSALLHGLGVLVNGPPAIQTALDACLDDWLPRIAARVGTAMNHATVASRWTRLVIDRTRRQAAPSPLFQSALMAAMLRAGQGSVAERVTRLTAADAMIAAASPDALPTQVFVDGAAGEARVWVELRRLRAAARDGRPLPAPPDALPGAWTLCQLLAAARIEAGPVGPMLGGDLATAAERHLLEALAPRIKRADHWLAMAPGERALMLFALLDLLEEPRPLPVAAAELLPEHISTGAAGTAGPEARLGVDSRRPTVLLRVLGRLATWEQLPLASLIEGRRLHALADSALALTLLPNRGSDAIDGEVASTLADVFEQQLRLSLARDVNFDPRRYLTLALVRRPPPTFATALVRLLAERTYVNTSGEGVALGDLIDSWRQALLDPEHADPAWRLSSPFRAQTGDLGSALHELAQWLGLDPDSRPRAHSVAAALERLHGDATPVLTTTGALDTTLSVRLADARDGMRRILDQGGRIEARAPTDPEEARALATELEAELGALQRALALHLPAPDAETAAEAFEHVHTELGRWAKGLELCQRWTTGGERASFDAADACMADLPPAIVPALLAALERQRGDGSSAEDAVLDRGLALLPRLPVTLHGAWRSGLAARWAATIEQSMRTGASDRVQTLLRESRYRPLTALPEATAALATARRFCFDRLQLRLARDVARLEGHGGALRGLGGFLLHYSAVWIGLLVGAILMLDFGDAWKSMAEEEDLGGILLTGLLGLGGTWAYLMVAQRRRIQPAAGHSAAALWPALLARTLGFLLLCTVYSLLATSGLWLLLSGTDEVVHGPWAIGHIVVWAGFALFIGTFFGLVAKEI